MVSIVEAVVSIAEAAVNVAVTTITATISCRMPLTEPFAHQGIPRRRNVLRRSSQILTKGKKPLTPDQEKKFSGLIETKLPQMQEELKAANPQMQQLLNSLNQNRNNNNNNNNATLNPQTLRNNIVNTIMTQLGIPNNNNNNNNNRGNRGNNNQNPNNNANANNAAANNNNQTANNANTAANNEANANNNRGRGNNNNNFNPQAEIQKKNEELYDKIAAKLNPDQATVIQKYKYDQIKAKGGAERYRGIMLEQGTPLTAEQFDDHSEPSQCQQPVGAAICGPVGSSGNGEGVDTGAAAPAGE